MRSKTWGLWTTGFVFAIGLGVVLAQSSETISVETDGSVEPVASEPTSEPAMPIDIGRIVPIPVGAVFRPYLVGVGEISVSAAADLSGSVVYSNLLGTRVFFPGGNPGALVGDDIATTASAGCVLGAMRFRVSGDPLGDGSGMGPFSVTFALYSACPGAGGVPLFGPITENLPDNGNHEVIFKPDPETNIEIPINAYFGVSFSRSLAAIVAGAPASMGFTVDRFDFPGGNCDAFFGGFPGNDHGSFDLEIFARNDCPDGVCSSTCVGGDNSGEFCFRDDCPSGTCTQDIACLGGLNNGDECTSDADCPNMCSGGPNNGIGCDGAGDCPSECRGGSNAGNFCDEDADCPNSSCSIGSCPNATCSGDRCVGGPNNLDLCFIDDCPSGSCSGTRACDGGVNADQACVFDCVASFPAYKNSGQGGSLFGKPPQSQFVADDIRLAIPVGGNNPCNLVSWEVGIKGGGILNAGAVQAELHTFIDDADPENGGRIVGTRMSDIISGSSVRFLRKTFATPIPLTQQDLFVVFKIQNNFVGPIITCVRSGPGSTEDLIRVHDGNSWNDQILDTPGATCFAAFEISLSCEGSPPMGACCDMELTEDRTCVGGSQTGMPCNSNQQCRVCDGGSRAGRPCDQPTDCPGGGFCPPELESFCVGDAVCRQLPQMNCAFPILWRDGEVCGATCDGGALDGESCGLQGAGGFDCPPACVGGSNDGGQCFNDSDCPGVCEEGGAFAGNACSSDSNCQAFPSDPTLCIDRGDCIDDDGAFVDLGVCRGSFCVGGDNPGAVCTRAIDCPGGGECGSSCMEGDNDGLPCVQGSQCPGGFCPDTPFPEPCGLGTCCTRNDLRCCATERDCNTQGTACGLGGLPLTTPVEYRVGQACSTGGCPRGACISREGDCTQARDGLCVGGTLDGDPCPWGAPCIPGINDCCAGENAGIGVCEGSPGCESSGCCSAVCATRLIPCCSDHWTQACANDAFQIEECRRIPANDTCFNPAPNKGASFIPMGSNVEVDLDNATGGTSQPGLCCFRSTPPDPPDDPGNPGGPGTRGFSTVWLKTIAPDGGTCRGQATGQADDGAPCTTNVDCSSRKCRSNMRVHTCNTVGGGGDDSILQVFSVGDLDSGLCEDRSVCKVSLQDCFDNSVCVLNEETACASLSPVGCSDDAVFEGSVCNNGNADFPFNSRLCVDVVPGDPYYILVAAKDVEAQGKYRVTTLDSCQNDPPVLFNDACSDAVPLGVDGFGCDSAGNCDVFFSLSGFGGAFATATFDCPGPGCLNTMENDVWYDWIAPATGRVSVETCAGIGETTPDTSLVIYNGCDCPVELGTELDCSETEVTSDCFLGSRVTAVVEGGQCYKMRLGGNFGDTPSGTLKIEFGGCPPGPITGVDPPNQTIDARAPVDPNTGLPLGIDSLTVQWPAGTGGTTDRACYSYCETLVDGFDPNDLFGQVTDNGDGTFTVNLRRPIAPGSWATLTAKHGDGSTSSVSVVALPTDVDASQSTDMADLTALIAALNNPATPFNKYQHDMDHSGALTPRDLLRWIDLASGVSGAFDPWLGRTGPECFPCCPN